MSGSRFSRRGAALITVLLLSAVMLVVCFSLATLSVLSLNLSSSFANATQTQLVAQAAVAQFMYESDRFYDQAYLSSTRPTLLQPDWKGRYQQPVFPGGERFPAQAHITFDPAEPYFSLDNSARSKPAAGGMDQGTSHKSIPPYAVDLWVRVEQGGTTHRYEAMLRRRWPYVLCSGGQIKLMGTPPLTSGGARVVDLTWPRSDINARVVVGVDSVARAGTSSDWYRVSSEGNLLFGNVDIMQQVPKDHALLVRPGNTHNGYVSTGGRPAGMFKALTRALKTPPAEGVDLPRSDPLPAPWNAWFKLLRPDEHYEFDSNRTVTTDLFYYLKSDVRFPPPGSSAAPTEGDFDYASDRQFVIRGSAGNRYFKPDINYHGLQTVSNRCSLTLDNCLLYVDGNLDLSSTRDVHGTRIPANLVGINATLIVNGNLILAGADIDAQDRGMVIYAQRLVGSARGHYRGLLMVQRAMALFPPELPTTGSPPPATETGAVQRLTVTGGIVCGGQDTRLVIADDPTWDTTPGHMGNPPSRVLRGLNLWSTVLEYDPQYLSTMHKFGPLTLMSLRRVE